MRMLNFSDSSVNFACTITPRKQTLKKPYSTLPPASSHVSWSAMHKNIENMSKIALYVSCIVPMQEQTDSLDSKDPKLALIM